MLKIYLARLTFPEWFCSVCFIFSNFKVFCLQLYHMTQFSFWRVPKKPGMAIQVSNPSAWEARQENNQESDDSLGCFESSRLVLPNLWDSFSFCCFHFTVDESWKKGHFWAHGPSWPRSNCSPWIHNQTQSSECQCPAYLFSLCSPGSCPLLTQAFSHQSTSWKQSSMDISKANLI